MAGSQITTRFGASVRSLRHRLGVSQEVLAERAGLHQTYIAGIEAGWRNVTLKSIEKLARALQVSSPLSLRTPTAWACWPRQQRAMLLFHRSEILRNELDSPFHTPNHVQARTRLDTNG